MHGKAIAGPETTTRNVRAERLGYDKVDRFGTRGDIREPYCHSDSEYTACLLVSGHSEFILIVLGMQDRLVYGHTLFCGLGGMGKLVCPCFLALHG